MKIFRSADTVAISLLCSHLLLGAASFYPELDTLPEGVSTSLKDDCIKVLLRSPAALEHGLERLHELPQVQANESCLQLPSQCIRAALKKRGSAEHRLAQRPAMVALNHDGSTAATFYWGVGISIFKHGKRQPVEIPIDLHGISAMAFINDTNLIVKFGKKIYIIDSEQKTHNECWTSETPQQYQRLNPLLVDPVRGKAAEFAMGKKLAVYDTNNISGACMVDIAHFSQLKIEDFKSGFIACIYDIDDTENCLTIIDVRNPNNIVIKEVVRGRLNEEAGHKIKRAICSFDGKYVAAAWPDRVEVYHMDTLQREKSIPIPKKLQNSFELISVGEKKILINFDIKRGSRLVLFDMLASDPKNIWVIPGIEALQWSSDGSVFAQTVIQDGNTKLRVKHLFNLLSLKKLTLEEQRFLLQAAQSWMRNEPFPVNPNNEVYQLLISKYPLLEHQRLFVFQEPTPLVPIFSSDSPASSSTDAERVVASSSKDRRSKKHCAIC